MRDIQPDQNVEQPNVLPFPLETTVEHLEAANIKLSDVLGQIGGAKRNPSLSKEKIKMLDRLDGKIKTIIGHVGKVTEEIININLD